MPYDKIEFAKSRAMRASVVYVLKCQRFNVQ